MKPLLAFLVLALSTALHAAPAAIPEKLFNGKEFSLDLYGTASLSNADRDPDHVRFGAGVGANYFFTRGLGFGLRGETDNAGHDFVDRAKGRVLFRAPLWDRIAPYGFVEGGFDFERDDWSAGAGGGLEFRFTRNIGVFGEAGLEMDTEDGAGRMRGNAGLRITF